MSSVRRAVAGGLVALGGVAALTAVMVAFRPHLAVGTPGVVLVVPVVAGVLIGGGWAGVVGATAGFLAYDIFFVPPFGTLRVGNSNGWVALAAYAAVVALVTRMVLVLRRAREEADRRGADAQRLYELSDALIGPQELGDVLRLVVSTLHEAFEPRWVALALPEGVVLTVAATAGAPTPAELDQVTHTAVPHHLAVGPEPEGGLVRVALTAAGRPVGLLVLAGTRLDDHTRFVLLTYANHAAMAIERSRLRDQALRSELLEESDKWRRALMGAVSHDLRTPLSTIKTAVSTLRTSDGGLAPPDRAELLELVELQADHLDRLVTNLLDMTRIEAGTLELNRAACPVADVVDGALSGMDAGAVSRVRLDLPPEVPPVEVDQLLMSQVVANLVDNALRYSPDGSPVELRAARRNGLVELSVSDRGPGVAPADRERVFQMFNRVSGGGRAGLGLTISKAFVDAHGQALMVEDAPGGGARFVLTMPVAPLPPEGH